MKRRGALTEALAGGRQFGKRLLWPLPLAPPFVMMCLGIAAPLHGNHLFRQAHVAANIERFAAHGLSLRPETYNLDLPYPLFDFPAYQWLVAELTVWLRTDPTATARAVSVLFFGLCLFVLNQLLRSTGARATQRRLALALFAYAPLCLFVFDAPMVDGLALLASLISMHAYTRWEGHPGGATGASWFVAMVGFGLLATLIKNPAYLPFFVAICWHRLRTGGWRSAVKPAAVAFALSIAGSVLLFQLYADRVNQIHGFLTRSERLQYFAAVGDRFRGGEWVPILHALTLQAANPVTLALGVLGFWLLSRSRRRWATLYTGLAMGSAVALLCLFPKYRDHNYYLLPFVVPVAILAAGAVEHGLALARAARWGRHAGARALGGGMRLAVLAVTVVFSWLSYQGISASSSVDAARGEWIRAVTRPDDFVIYVVPGEQSNWDPHYLYFAKREGYNLARGELDLEHLAPLYARFRARYPRILVFCSDPVACRQLEALGVEGVAADRKRHLYRVEGGPAKGACLER